MAVRYERCFRGSGDRQCRGGREEFGGTHYGLYNTSPRPVLQYLITAPADIKNKIIDEKVKAPSPGTDVSVIYASHHSHKPTPDRWSWQYNPLSDPRMLDSL